MEKFARGSEWRRWDLHVHTPETQKNDQFQGRSEEEKWELFYNSISAYVGDGKDPVKTISVIGITDYLSVENYKKVVRDKKLPREISLVLPNVELRMAPIARKHPVNIHCIFNPVLVDELETRFFSKLEFDYNGRKYGASYPEVCQLGRAYTGDDSLCDKEAYKSGLEQYVLTLDSLKKVFENDSKLRENTIIAVSNGSGDGASGTVEHSSYLAGASSQMDATRRSIYQMADVIFSSKESDRKYFLGMGSDSKEIVKSKCGSLMGCIHGSDAHTNEKLFEPDENRYCWIKADPTFNGLRQIIYEPESRICISPIKPEIKPDYHVIERVEILDVDFSSEPIHFNDKLTCIIGGKSTGKSLLLHNIAKTIDPKQVEIKSNIAKNSSKNISGLKVVWADGTIDDSEENDTAHKIVYIPQTYLNRLSDENEEITEIDKIIHEILMLDDTIECAYENMNTKIKNQKVKIDRMVYDLVQQYNILNNKKKKIADIGNRLGIEKELSKLKKQKEKLSKDLTLSEEEIKEYDDAISIISRKNYELNKKREEYEQISRISTLVQKRDITNIFSQEIVGDVERATVEAIKLADNSWEVSKKEILRKIESIVTKLQEELNIEQKIIDKLGPKVSENEAINRLTESIKAEEEKLRICDIVISEIEQSERIYIELISDVSKTFTEYYEIHNEYEKVVNERSLERCEDLEFSANSPFRKDMFVRKIEGIFDRRTLRAHKEIVDTECFSDSWINQENVQSLVKACIEGTIRLTGGRSSESALREILDDWYNSTYHVKMDFDLIDDMSPGKKALVLLKMLINLAESKCPILIDQPEDDLDNRSIFTELIPFIKKKRLSVR